MMFLWPCSVDAASVLPVIGELEPAGMTQHMRMDGEGQAPGVDPHEEHSARTYLIGLGYALARAKRIKECCGDAPAESNGAGSHPYSRRIRASRTSPRACRTQPLAGVGHPSLRSTSEQKQCFEADQPDHDSSQLGCSSCQMRRGGPAWPTNPEDEIVMSVPVATPVRPISNQTSEMAYRRTPDRRTKGSCPCGDPRRDYFTEMRLGCAFACFLMEISSTPWRPVALTFSASAVSGKIKRR
jgi:hypothetical protein